jgi:FkbM family methyltransferase
VESGESGIERPGAGRVPDRLESFWRWLAVFGSGLRQLPRTVFLRVFTRLVSDRTRRSWKDRGWFAMWDRMAAGGRIRIPFGLAENMYLATEHFDLAGAQGHAMLRGLHEPMVQEALRRTLADGSTFYDVGANMGFMTLVGARLVGPAGRVVSIEPEPENVAAIEANAAINGIATITVIAAAAAAESGPVEVIGVRDTLWTRLAEVGEHPMERERLLVPGVRLDDLVYESGIDPPDVVKIDVEGGELQVLAGMSRLLRDRRPAIIAEMHGKNAAVCELLREAGYRIINLDGPESPERAGDNVHLLAQPAG